MQLSLVCLDPGHVKFHKRHRPFDQGDKVNPSGRCCRCTKARAWGVAVDRRICGNWDHDDLCYRQIHHIHKFTCGAHTDAPIRRNATAIRRDELSNSVYTDQSRTCRDEREERRSRVRCSSRADGLYPPDQVQLTARSLPGFSPTTGPTLLSCAVWRLDWRIESTRVHHSPRAALNCIRIIGASHLIPGMSSETRGSVPATDDKKAGRATWSVALRIPMPPFATGSVACSHCKRHPSVDTELTAMWNASLCRIRTIPRSWSSRSIKSIVVCPSRVDREIVD